MINYLYLVEHFDKNGNYCKTSRVVFTSKEAAEKYAKDCCTHTTKVVKVNLLALNDF